MFPAGGSGRGVRALMFQRVMALSKPSRAMSPAASAARATASSNAPLEAGSGGVKT